MSTIQLSWAAVLPPGSTYTVWRNGAIVATQLGATSYLDTTVADNTTYTYTVAAVNAYGPGLTSSPASATTPPAQVTGLTATAVSSSQINLSWTAAAGATSYTVRRGGSVVGTPAGASFSDTGLTANTLYTYTVAANGTGGQGAQSAAASATTLSSGITWKPGIRVFPGGTSGNRNVSNLTNVLAGMDAVDAWDVNKVVRGFLLPMWMSDLEISQGVYDDPVNVNGFSKIQALINKAKSYNPPRDISFYINLTGNGQGSDTSTSFPSFAIPGYLNSSTYGGGAEWAGNPATPSCPTVRGTFWNVNFASRITALVQAYYNHFGPSDGNGNGIYYIELTSEVSIGTDSKATWTEFYNTCQTWLPALRAAAPKLMMSIRLSFGFPGSVTTYLPLVCQLMQQNQIAMANEDHTNAVYNASATLSQANQNAFFAWGDQYYCGLYQVAGPDHRTSNDWCHIGNVEIAEYGNQKSALSAVPPASKGSGYIYDNPNFPGIMTGTNFIKTSHLFFHVDEGQFGPNINNTHFYSNAPNNPTPGPGAGTNAARPHLGDVITGNQAYAAQGVQGALTVASTAYPTGWP